MACGVTRYGIVCQNAGSTSHTGQHEGTGVFYGRQVTVRWSSPATGQTAVNSDASPAWHKAIAVGVLDI